MQNTRWAPYVILGIGVTVVSWSAVLIREADAPALVIASYRLVLAALPVGTLALIQQRRAPEPITSSSLRPTQPGWMCGIHGGSPIPSGASRPW